MHVKSVGIYGIGEPYVVYQKQKLGFLQNIRNKINPKISINVLIKRSVDCHARVLQRDEPQSLPLKDFDLFITYILHHHPRICSVHL